jgi:hypothetical protein
LPTRPQLPWPVVSQTNARGDSVESQRRRADTDGEMPMPRRRAPGIALGPPRLHRHGVNVPRAPVTSRQWWIALLLACGCSLLFLRDALLPGRVLVPHPPELFDVQMAEAHAAGGFDAADVFRGNVAGTDKYLQSLCWDRVMQDRFRAGELPRWTNDIGGGAPFVPQMAQPWQPINGLLLLVPSAQWYGWWWFVHQVLFGVFAYAFLRRLGCAHAAALLGLVAAVLGLWAQCKIHHNVILTAALSVWPMLAAVHALVADGVRGRERTFAIGWLGMWSGLAWSTGFVPVALQATYLALAAAAGWALAARRGERLARLVPVGLGLALGAWLATANMAPILEAAAHSSREGRWPDAQLQSFGLEWEHALGVLWPDLLSWGADRFYADVAGTSGGGPPFAYATRMPLAQLLFLAPLRDGDHAAFQSWVETSCAIGLVPLAAGLVALFDRAHRRTALVAGGIALLAFGFATADQPFLALAKLVPGFAAGDLRRLLFSVSVALVVLAGLGGDALLRGARRWPAVVLLAMVAALSAVALLWLPARGDDAAFAHQAAALYVLDGDAKQGADTVATATLAAAAPGEIAHNRTMLATTAWRALLVAALGLAALARRGSLVVPAGIALTITELLHAGLGPVQTVPAERVTRPPRVLAPVAAAAPPNGERARLCRLVAPGAQAVAALPGNVPGFLRLEDSSAYNPLPPARAEEFFAQIETGLPREGTGIGAMHVAASLQHPLCDLYGLRFVLTREAVPAALGLVDRTPPGTGAFRLYERPTALPLATFVQRVDVLPDKRARLEALAAKDREVAHRVVLEDAAAPAVAPGDAANATVTLVERRDERVVVRVRSDAPGYLRLADPWHPGWRATLDGDATRLYVADHYLRAVHVPAGEHEVVFTFDGATVVWPLRATIAAWLLVAWLLWRGRRCAP